MPPRYAYWTIIVDNQPTAFRAGALEDILPTFNRLKERQPTAVLKWFQSGQLWNSRLDARDAMRKRSQQGRSVRRGPTSQRSASTLQWQPKGPQRDVQRERFEWKPRSAHAAPHREGESSRPEDPQPKRRDAKWRPGGDHKDPRQKYKDAKKAKWGRFTQAIRQRHTKRKP